MGFLLGTLIGLGIVCVVMLATIASWWADDAMKAWDRWNR